MTPGDKIREERRQRALAALNEALGEAQEEPVVSEIWDGFTFAKLKQQHPPDSIEIWGDFSPETLKAQHDGRGRDV